MNVLTASPRGNGSGSKGKLGGIEMALIKRGRTWHTHFFVDSQRFRQSLGTSDWREAQQKEKELIAAAQAGKLSSTKQESARLPFRDAAERFLQDRIPQLASLSMRTEKERAKVVNKKFGDTQVARITPDTVLAHVRERKAAGISNATVNRELDIIRGVLKKAKRWHLFADEIRPLPVRQNIGRALSYDEKLRLLKFASSRPEWQNAAWATSLALNTTMRGCEIKQLKWRDVDLMERTLTIRKSKTEAGERVIPLNADSWNAVLSLYRRAQALGDVLPEHYVFPSCEASHFDPARPMASWRTAWRNLRKAAGLPNLRFHDLRHHAITELAESQASDSTVMAIAGHVSAKMLQHYSHVRLQAKRTALDALSTRRTDTATQRSKEGGYDTNNDTKQQSEAEKMPQVIENLVELVGIEPTTSSLRTMRSPS
jgi:integrase